MPMDLGTVKAEVQIDGRWRLHVAPFVYRAMKVIAGHSRALHALNRLISKVRVRCLLHIGKGSKWVTIANGILVTPDGRIEAMH